MTTATEQPLLKDIPQEKGFPIAHLLRISNLEFKTTKSDGSLCKKPYLMFNLGDKSADIKYCKKWDSSEEEFEKLKKSKVVFVTGKIDTFNNSTSIVCETIAKPEDGTETEHLEQLSIKSLYDVSIMKKEIWNYIQKMENPYIKQLAELTLKDPIVKERLGTWQAATNHHHAYKSGLITHIFRLMKIADKFVDTINDNMYPNSKLKINKDMVMLGILLHDLWKIRTYNEDGSYSNWANIIEHLPYGPIDAARKMDQIKDFPENLREPIYHMILSHHGNYGPVKPKSPCAIILHYLDDCFAKLDPCLEALEKLPEGEDFTSESLKALDGKAWMGATLRKK